MTDDSDDEVPILISHAADKVVPITILSGFLGSGKTTLLNYILKHSHGKRIAVVENEFSAGLGIESMIAKSGVDGQNIEGFFELNNGCICCSSKGDLLATLENLLLLKDRFDYILIECTGLANPGPVIASLWCDSAVNTFLKLDGVVTLVDCVNMENYYNRADISNDVTLQIAYADRIILNKIDIATADQLNKSNEIVKSINATAAVYQTSFASIVDLSMILNIDTLNLNRTMNQDKLLLLTLNNELTTSNPMLTCMPCVNPSVPNVFAVTNNPTGKSMHIAQQLTSIGIILPGRFDLSKLKSYVDSLIYNNSNQGHASSNQLVEIIRMKGIVRVFGDDSTLYILQSICDIFDITSSTIRMNSADDITNGMNKFIVIGKNLDQHALTLGLTACMHV